VITRLSHATIYVLDQDEALKFYRDKLGFEVRDDMTMDNGFRWLTVGPKTQPDLDMGAGVLSVDDCRKTYEELKAKGVEFLSPPTDSFYGVEALFKDNSGNWFSMTEHKKWK